MTDTEKMAGKRVLKAMAHHGPPQEALSNNCNVSIQRRHGGLIDMFEMTTDRMRLFLAFKKNNSS